MKKTLPVVVFAIFAFIFFSGPQSAFAQRGGGGHGGHH